MTEAPSGSRGGFLWGLVKDLALAVGVTMAAFSVWSVLGASQPVVTGDAPVFTLPNLEGEQVSLEDFSDGPVILNFWFTQCGPCRREIPELSSFQDAHPEVPILGISVDRGMTTDVLARHSERLGIRYSVLHDPRSRVANDYGVSFFPTTFIVRSGKIERVRQGTVTRARLEKWTGL